MEENGKQGRFSRRSVIALCAVSAFLLFLRTSFVSTVLKEMLLVTVNNLSDYEINLDSVQVKPLRFGLSFENVSISDSKAQQPIAQIETIFVGFKVPYDGQIIRSILIDSPQIVYSLKPSNSAKSSDLSIPLLPKILIRSANLLIRSSNAEVLLSDVNFTHQNGMAQLWTEQNVEVNLLGKPVVISPFQWNAIELGLDRAYLGDIDLHSSLGTLTGAFSIDQNVMDGSLATRIDLAQLDWDPKWSYTGLMDVSIVPSGFFSNPTFEIQGDTNKVEINRAASTRNFTYVIEHLELSTQFKQQRLNAISSTIEWAGGKNEVNGVIDLKSNEVTLDIKGEGQNVWDLAQDLDLSMAPWVEMKFDSQVNLSGQLRPLDLKGNLHILGEDFRVAGRNVRESQPHIEFNNVLLDGEVQLTSSNLAYILPLVELQRNGVPTVSTGVIEGDFSFKSPNQMQVRYDFSQLDLEHLYPLGNSNLKGLAKGFGVVEGPIKELRTSNQFYVQDFEMLGLSYADSIAVKISGSNLKTLEFDVVSATKGHSEMQGILQMRFGSELWIDGVFKTEAAHAKDLMSIFFEPLDVDALVDGDVHIKGYSSNLLVQTDMQLTNISLWGEPFDMGEFRLTQTSEGMTIESLCVERKDGLGSVLMRGTRNVHGNNFEVLVGGLPIEYLSWVIGEKYPVRGKVNFIGTMKGDSFMPTGSIQLRDVWYGTQAFHNGEILLNPVGDELVFQGDLGNVLSFEGKSGFSLDDDYWISFATKDFPIGALYPLKFEDAVVSAILDVKGVLQQQSSEISGDVLFNRAMLTWADRSIGNLDPWKVFWSPNVVQIEEVHFQGTGSTDIVFAGTQQDQHRDFWGRGTLDLSVLEFSLSGTQLASGKLFFDGEWSDTGLTIDGNIENGVLRGDWFPHPIESIRSSLRYQGETVQINSFESVIGGGDVQMSGTVEVANGFPDRLDLSMNVNNSRIQFLDWLPSVLTGGKLRITGPMELPMISGNLDIQQMVFQDRIDWESTMVAFAPDALSGSFTEDAEPYIQYDIDVSADNSIRIRNNLADMVASADLKFIGTLANPGMLGEIDLQEGGRALFKERDFHVQRGVLRYVDAESFDPLLDIVMDTSITTPEQEVGIVYYVTGLYSDWQTHTTSTPSMPQADINALLLFGMTRRQLEAAGGLGTALAIEGSDLMVSIGQRFVEVSPGIFQNELLHLDRVDIISGPTDRNSAYVSSALRFLAEKDFGDGTLRLEQNITDTSDVFVSWEQKLSNRIYTRMYWASQQQGRYTNRNGAVGAEFEIEWELD